jgi:ATP-dependent helicase HrpB
MIPLPIDELVPRIVASLGQVPGAVVLAPPGAGKTTRLAPALLDSVFLHEGKKSVLLLQPRRVAARAAATRIAEERGWRVGEEVGWQVRFERRIGPRTRLEVLTEGILARRLLGDPFLEGVGAVILDEFHERSIHTDLALALLRELQAGVREDLRLVIMSATMDAAPVAGFLGGAPVFESEGRLYPVEIRHLPKEDRAPLWDLAGRAIHAAAAMPECGHILVFLPGMSEIRRTRERLGSLGGEVHVLHSTVSSEEQDRALRPCAGRKIVLATNIAETSLTIDGVRTVIDGGYARVPARDARLGVERLELRRISLASARQRAGRAGRTAPGRCIRLWTIEEEAAFPEHDVPELHRIDLAGTVLLLKSWGIADATAFSWFESPKADVLQSAEKLLVLLGAVDDAGALTAVGRQMAALPLHPRLARMLLEADARGTLADGALLAALLSERDVLAQPRRNALDSDSDLLDRLELMKARSPLLDEAAARAVQRLASQLEAQVRRGGAA